MFRDRKDAGERLGAALEKYRGEDVLVLGIPRGGAETAYYVAKHLDAELSLVVSRKLGYPFNDEAAMGALAEDGSIYLFSAARQEVRQKDIDSVMEKEKKEILRRVKTLRNGKPLPEMKGRTVIIVDDGIATGATLFATIELCKNRNAGKIVVAAPVSGRKMEDTLSEMADEVVILLTLSPYYAVSQGYENFYNLTDEEVINFMNRWEHDHQPAQ